jgi:hypothetical protein
LLKSPSERSLPQMPAKKFILFGTAKFLTIEIFDPNWESTVWFAEIQANLKWF